MSSTPDPLKKLFALGKRKGYLKRTASLLRSPSKLLPLPQLKAALSSHPSAPKALKPLQPLRGPRPLRGGLGSRAGQGFPIDPQEQPEAQQQDQAQPEAQEAQDPNVEQPEDE